MNNAQKRALALKLELSEVDRKLNHALERAERLGDLAVPEDKRALKAKIIDRYNDDINALSQRRWELGTELDDLRDSRLGRVGSEWK